MLPDGRETDERILSIEASSGVSVREALKMRAFWSIGVASMLQMIAIYGVTLYPISRVWEWRGLKLPFL
jgi:hypothetical protein